jgi:hypothetical protein
MDSLIWLLDHQKQLDSLMDAANRDIQTVRQKLKCKVIRGLKLILSRSIGGGEQESWS